MRTDSVILCVPETKAQRIAAHDPRRSIEERYGTHQGYVCVVTNAANEAVKQRFCGRRRQRRSLRKRSRQRADGHYADG